MFDIGHLTVTNNMVVDYDTRRKINLANKAWIALGITSFAATTLILCANFVAYRHRPRKGLYIIRGEKEVGI